MNQHSKSCENDLFNIASNGENRSHNNIKQVP